MQEPNIAALAIERFMAPSDPVLLKSSSSNLKGTIDTRKHLPTLMLDKVETLLTPQEIDRHDNTKMIYRTSSLKLAWVHWEVAFKSNLHQNTNTSNLKKRIEKLDDGIMLIHINKSKGRGPFNTSFIIKDKFKEHLENVREGCWNMIARLPWLAS